MFMNRYRYLLQEKIEKTFSKKFITAAAVDDLLTCESIVNKLNRGIEYVNSWLNKDHDIDRELRLLAVRELDIKELVMQVVACISLECQKPMKLVSVASLCARHLNMSDKVEAIHTMAEIIAVLGETDLFDNKKTREGWIVLSRVELDSEVTQYADNALYLPPLIIKPRKVRSNRDSGYITQRGESLILGFYENHHDDNICLDVLNILNSNEYELDTDFINQYEEQWHREELSQQEYEELSHADREIYNMDEKNWKKFQEQGKFFQALMIHHGNSFYLCNKVDKRGRIYSSGYHVNVQGSSFKKAMVNFKHREIPTGLSSW
jgi:hypothetical protein